MYHEGDDDQVNDHLDQMTAALEASEAVLSGDDREQKVVFATGESDDGGAPLLLLGVPELAWEYMRDGMTSTFDLTKVGLGIRLIIFGGDSHESVMQIMKLSMAQQLANLPIVDRRGEDFSIKPTK